MYSEWIQYSYDSADMGNEIVNTAGYPGQLPLQSFQISDDHFGLELCN